MSRPTEIFQITALAEFFRRPHKHTQHPLLGVFVFSLLECEIFVTTKATIQKPSSLFAEKLGFFDYWGIALRTGGLIRNAVEEGFPFFGG